MTPDPAPDYSVIGIYADGSMLPFILSTGRMAMNILSNDVFTYPFKTALLERRLLAVATLQELLEEGYALLPEGSEEEDDEDDEDGNSELAEEEAVAADADRPTWLLTLPEVLILATATDLAASLYLSPLADEARAVQVDLNGVPPEVYDAKVQETLGYLSRFQTEWTELFGKYAGYQARMAELAQLRAEYL